MFHSLRIPMFGIQLAKSGKIYDFSCANKIWTTISTNSDWKWDQLDIEFRVLRNQILTDFRHCTQK